MSQIVSLLDSIDVICPHCGEFNEISDIAVSMTIEDTDVMRKVNECQFTYGCENCHKEFKLNPEMNVAVEKV